MLNIVEGSTAGSARAYAECDVTEPARLPTSHGGVRRCVVLSSLARHGLFWQGRVLSGRVPHGEVLHCKVWRGLSG